MRTVWVIITCLLLSVVAMAQYPYYHNITTEEGLPSNQVYSIVQDADGFMWIGCEVGLVRYNGLMYKQYKNQAQKSRIIAGLTISKTGRIYGYNFSNQIFYFENDSLYELKGWQGGVTNIAHGPDGRFWVSGMDGLYAYQESTNSWDTILRGPNKGICIDKGGAVWFLNLDKNEIGYVDDGKTLSYSLQPFKGEGFNIGRYLLSVGGLGNWVFSVTGGEVYKFNGKAYEPFVSVSLNDALAGRKCNHVLQMPDGRIWLCTYSGVVVYNPAIDQTEVLYDGVSFSNAMLGREGGIWLTSLHIGLLYIPDMGFLNWNKAYGTLPSNSITQLHLHGSSLYYGTSDGYFGEVDLDRKTLQSHYLGMRSDIHGLCFDSLTQSLWFNVASSVYKWGQGKLDVLADQTPPIKSILRAGGQVYYAASFGLYVADSILGDESSQKISEPWTRDLLYHPASQNLWAATDSGIRVLHAPTRHIETTILPGKQVVAIATDSDRFYALLFTGQIVAVNSDYSTQVLATLPNEANGTDLETANGQLLVATNQGLWVFTMATGKWFQVDKTLGLASNNIKAIKVFKNQVWLATGSGLQTIPLGFVFDKPRAMVYLRSLAVNGVVRTGGEPLLLVHNDVLGFVPEASAYSSMDKFQFAYRLLDGDTAWQYLPASTQHFSLPSIAPGDFIFQLKVVDHTGRDSENIVTLQGYMQPPFWQRWWFYVLLALAGVFLAFVGFRYRLRAIRRKQQQELERVQLQNELELSQQAALKAQMNPHFIFNVLNSIKSYIYENDKKSAAEYLSTFAKLIRRILTMSGEANVSLEEELEALELYIQLEAMLLEPPFEHTIHIGPDIDVSGIRLPALLIQPYVENAFEHGLRHQKGLKQLAIAIAQLPNGHLQITIDDNGIGREAAAVLNKDRLPGHRSFAVSANSKRLSLLNKNDAGSVNMVYIDKTDNAGLPGGTSVIITIKTT